MKTEFLTWHCNNILKMRAICTFPSRIIEREPVFNQEMKKLYSSNEILLFPLGPASTKNLLVPWSVALVNLTGSPFFFYCTCNIFQNFPWTLRAPSPARFMIRLPAGTEWVGWVWAQTMSSLNGTDVPNKPSAAQQGHPMNWENLSEHLPGMSFSQTHV